MNVDSRAELALTQDLVTAYFAAGSQAEIDALELRIRERSSGLASGYSVTQAGHEARWLGALMPVEGGLLDPRLFGASYNERLFRIAHVELVAPVPHPRGRGVTQIVPVIGPALREPVFGDGVYAESPCNALYRQLARANQVAAASSDFLREQMIASMQTCLVRIAAGWPQRAWDAWSEPDATFPVAIEPPAQPKLPASPTKLVALRAHDDGTAVIAFPHALVVVRLRDGKPLRTWLTHGTTFLATPRPGLALVTGDVPSGGTVDLRAAAYEATTDALAAMGITDASAYAGAFETLADDAPEMVTRVFALDLATGAWIDRPDDVPRVWFTESLESSYLLDDAGRAQRLEHIADYPVIAAFTPDHRFVWIEDKHGGGGVFRARDGALVTVRTGELDGDVPRLTRAGAIVTPSPSEPGAKQDAHAIVCSRRGRWLSITSNVVCEGWRPFLAVDGPSTHAAFTPDACTLCLADDREVRCIDVSGGTPRVTAKWPLAPVRAAAKPKPKTKPKSKPAGTPRRDARSRNRSSR